MCINLVRIKDKVLASLGETPQVMTKIAETTDYLYFIKSCHL